MAITGSIITTGAGFVAASHTAWAVIAGCAAGILLGGLASTSPWALETARRNGEKRASLSPAEPRHADTTASLRSQREG